MAVRIFCSIFAVNNKCMMNDLEKREDLVRRAIAKYRNEPDFPQFEDYGGDEDLLDDYFYLQTPQGSMEEEKRKLTIYGVLIIVPIAVVSFFFRDITGLLMGVLIGGVLSGYFGIRTIWISSAILLAATVMMW